jgi:hypothetical protein
MSDCKTNCSSRVKMLKLIHWCARTYGRSVHSGRTPFERPSGSSSCAAQQLRKARVSPPDRIGLALRFFYVTFQARGCEHNCSWVYIQAEPILIFLLFLIQRTECACLFTVAVALSSNTKSHPLAQVANQIDLLALPPLESCLPAHIKQHM